MRLRHLSMPAYGRCRDVGIDIGDGVTVVLGANEAGKSTALEALSDLLWGIPLNTTQTSEFPRPQLRIEAVVDLDGTPHTVVRTSTGLFTGDPAAEILRPWDPDHRLDEQWWRTRLGMNHAELRQGGRDVFDGTGDIAELVFAARQGRSARALLTEITQHSDKLFKAHRGNKNVLLRVAAKEYQQAVDDRDARLTRADEVVAQRAVVASLQRERNHAKDAVTATSRSVKQAVEDQRAIESVLELRQAGSELEAIAADGDRLSVAELAEHTDATAALHDAEGQLTELDGEITGRTRDIDELSVDDRLTDDKATLDRLGSDARARIEELNRADDEFGPDAATETARLRELLHSIGIDTADDVDDIDAALARARVRTDYAATLDDLAGRIEGLETDRQEARTARDKALDDLAAEGVGVEIAQSTAPSQEAISKLRDALGAAHTKEATAKGLLTKSRQVSTDLRAQAPTPHTDAALTHTDVVDQRRGRDAQWSTIRRSWVTGELPVPADRVDMAAEFDEQLEATDRVADDEATQRARGAAQDARIAAHVEGIDAARREEQLRDEESAAAAQDRRRLESRWAAVWADLGVADIPSVDSGLAVAGLLCTAHAAHSRELSIADQIAELAGSFRAAAELVGLPVACTTAAWRKQAEILGEIHAVQARRVNAGQRETQARRKWRTFSAEAVDLLTRHGGVDDGPPVSPALVEQGLTKLAARLSTATAAAAQRAAYRKEIDKHRAARKKALQVQQDAGDSLQRLAGAHSVTVGQALDALAERAERASKPIALETEARRGIQKSLDPGSDPRTVIDRLAEHDQVTVEQAVAEARRDDAEAKGIVESIGEKYTSARDRLAELEEATGAADAEARVAAHQAEVARLAEMWAIVTLQKKLLEDVLEGLGADQARPLLDHAGRLLEQLTEGRWVALRAEENGDSRRLLVIRSDAARFGTTQLSEGTADQVFLALRLAAVAELHNERTEAGEPSLPLVLDDVLMAFDEVRVGGALKVLEGLAAGLQVVVFTHHRHVAAAAAEFERITVSQLPPAAPIADAHDGGQVRARAQQDAAPIAAGPASAVRRQSQPDPKAVRDWAQAQGFEVNAKGRVPRDLVDRYLQAVSV